MKLAKDTLFEILEHHLLTSIVEGETQEDLIIRVAKDYVQEIMSQGFVPAKYMDALIMDVEEEVREMVRKKTYGYYDLDAYRESINEEQEVECPKKRMRSV